MLCCKNPFQGKTDEEIRANILKSELAFRGSIWKGISREAKNLINLMLEKDPSLRIEAKDAIYHTWIQEHTANIFEKYFVINSNN